jgi:hypothetical protein
MRNLLVLTWMKLWVDLLLKAWQYVAGHSYWVTVGNEWVPGEYQAQTITTMGMIFQLKKALLNAELNSIKRQAANLTTQAFLAT